MLDLDISRIWQIPQKGGCWSAPYLFSYDWPNLLHNVEQKWAEVLGLNEYWVNGTDNMKEILNLFKEYFKGNDGSMQQENNGLILRIDEVNNFFVDIAIYKLKEGIDCRIYTLIA